MYVLCVFLFVWVYVPQKMHWALAETLPWMLLKVPSCVSNILTCVEDKMQIKKLIRILTGKKWVSSQKLKVTINRWVDQVSKQGWQCPPLLCHLANCWSLTDLAPLWPRFLCKRIVLLRWWIPRWGAAWPFHTGHNCLASHLSWLQPVSALLLL